MASFSIGQKVEVCSKEEGFLGSYFEATIISRVTEYLYSVEYKNLVQEEDQSIPLVETIMRDELRPRPPKFRNSKGYYSYGEQVDAFDNDGWWVGEISGKKGSKKYRVYFENSRVTVAYPVSSLRSHLDWKDEHWTRSVFKNSA